MQADVDTYFPEAVQSPALNPSLAAFLAGGMYKSTAGPRVAVMAGTIGLGAVIGTYTLTSVTGMKFANTNFMFF